MDPFRKKQQSNCGVGGMHCGCCNKHRKKDKYKLNKISRKQLKVEDYKDVNYILTTPTREEILNNIIDEDIEMFWKKYNKKIYEEYI